MPPEKAPVMTIPLAAPSRVAGSEVRGKSKPIPVPGPPTASTITSRKSSTPGALPGHSSTAAQTTMRLQITMSASVLRRSGCRAVRAPITGPANIAATDSVVKRPDASSWVSPCPTIR